MQYIEGRKELIQHCLGLVSEIDSCTISQALTRHLAFSVPIILEGQTPGFVAEASPLERIPDYIYTIFCFIIKDHRGNS